MTAQRGRASGVLGVGLIGLGRHGRRYATHLTAGDVPGARLVAVWRRDTRAGRRDAQRYGVGFAPTARALCHARDVDIVALVVPPGLYPPLVAAAAAAGKALLIEKPLAANARSARRILAAVRRARVPAMVAHTLRFDPRIAMLRRRLRRLGAVRGVTCVQRLEDRGLAWEHGSEHGPGGILHQTGTHALDLVRFVTGLEARRVSCVLRQVHNPRVPDLAAIRLELNGGAVATVDVDKVSKGRSLVIEVACDRGIARADLVVGRVSVMTGATATRRGRRREWAVREAPTVPIAFRAFVRAIRRGEPGPVPLVDAARTHALLETAHRSARRDGARLVPLRLT